MNIGIVGGTGFVGGYLTEALLNAGHELRLLVRPGSEDKVAAPDRVTMVPGDLRDETSLATLLVDCDAVVYSVGILRESGEATFEETQLHGFERTLAAAQACGVQRLLLMSALGVKADGTPYQSTKYRAEQLAFASPLDVTVFRPSVIFGDPCGKMEFATQLYQDMVKPPIPAVAFFTGLSPEQGAVMMSPVHVEDVATAFARAVDDPGTYGRTYCLGGPDALSWKQILKLIGAAVGRRKLIIPMPLAVMRTAALALDWIPAFPVTADQLTMLAEGSVVEAAALRELIGRPPRSFTAETLGYLA